MDNQTQQQPQKGMHSDPTGCCVIITLTDETYDNDKGGGFSVSVDAQGNNKDMSPSMMIALTLLKTLETDKDFWREQSRNMHLARLMRKQREEDKQ